MDTKSKIFRKSTFIKFLLFLSIIVGGLAFTHIPKWYSQSARGVISEHVNLPNGEAPTDIKLIKKLNDSLKKNPDAIEFIFYWNDVDNWSMSYNRITKTLIYIKGDKLNECRKYIYNDVTIKHIEYIVNHKSNILILQQLGLLKMRERTNGYCE